MITATFKFTEGSVYTWWRHNTWHWFWIFELRSKSNVRLEQGAAVTDEFGNLVAVQPGIWFGVLRP